MVDFVNSNGVPPLPSMLLGYFLPLPKYDAVGEFQIALIATPGLAKTKCAG